MTKPFTISTRVYYEDTDSQGVMYYANYLKFAERGRTELLRTLGAFHNQLLEQHNLLFVVRRLTIDYLSPARLDDCLEIATEIVKLGGASLDMHQVMSREGKPLAELTVTIVAVTPAGQVLRLPKTLSEAIAKFLKR